MNDDLTDRHQSSIPAGIGVLVGGVRFDKPPGREIQSPISSDRVPPDRGSVQQIIIRHAPHDAQMLRCWAALNWE